MLVAVDVGDDDIAVDFREDRLDVGQRREHGCHEPVVGHRHLRHLSAPGADRLEGFGEAERVGRDERAVLAEAVAHHHVRVDAIGVEETGEGLVDGEHCGLGDLGLAELLVDRGEAGLVVRVSEDVIAEGAAEDGGHHAIGFGERLRHDRVAVAQVGQHVRVLRALPRVEEGHRRG